MTVQRRWPLHRKLPAFRPAHCVINTCWTRALLRNRDDEMMRETATASGAGPPHRRITAKTWAIPAGPAAAGIPVYARGTSGPTSLEPVFT